MQNNTISISIGTPLDVIEETVILQTLEATGNNQKRAAALLGISVRTLQRKIKNRHTRIYSSEKNTAP